MIPREFIVPYLVANAFAFSVLALAVWRPRAARWMSVGLFAWAAVINAWTALTNPQDYVNYAALAASSVYRAFIQGWFSQHVPSMVIPIAAGQLAIACLLAIPRRTTRRLGALGAIVFLLAIAPLGVGSGFPFSLTMIAALVVMERRHGRRTAGRGRMHETVVKPSWVVLVLVGVIAKLAAVAAGVGVFYDAARGPSMPTTVADAAMKTYGHGIYQYDSLLVGAGFTGVDAVTLFAGIPLLIVSAVLYYRASVRGGLLLLGTLAYFLYNYASMALGAAYNDLFLVYVALFSASLFAFVFAFTSFDLPKLPACFWPGTPRRWIAAYLIAVCVLLLTLWVGDVVAALASGRVPEALGSYTTVVTYALDLGIVAPAALTAAVLLLRRRPAGYLLASTLLTMTVPLGAALMAQGAAILMAGIEMPAGQIAGMIGSFAVFSLIGTWLTVVVLRGVSTTRAVADGDVRYAA